MYKFPLIAIFKYIERAAVMLLIAILARFAVWLCAGSGTAAGSGSMFD